MAKTSVRNRNAKRVKLADKFRPLREKYRNAVSDMNLSDAERFEAMLSLQELPRDSSPTRQRNRCQVCGRPRGYNKLTGFCRLHMRKYHGKAGLPGVRKSSW